MTGRSLLLLVLLILGGCYATTNLDNRELNYQPDEDTLNRGQRLYTEYCMGCHGADLSGNGRFADSLEKPPANLNRESLHITQTTIKTVVDYPHYSNEAISDKVKYGNDHMPPLKGALSSAEISDLVYYISNQIRLNSEN